MVEAPYTGGPQTASLSAIIVAIATGGTLMTVCGIASYWVIKKGIKAEEFNEGDEEDAEALYSNE